MVSSASLTSNFFNQTCNYCSQMAPIPNHRVIFNSVPIGYPVLGETLIFDKNATIDLEDPNLVPAGSALVKTILLSVDPYMRLSYVLFKIQCS